MSWIFPWGLESGWTYPKKLTQEVAGGILLEPPQGASYWYGGVVWQPLERQSLWRTLFCCLYLQCLLSVITQNSSHGWGCEWRMNQQIYIVDFSRSSFRPMHPHYCRRCTNPSVSRLLLTSLPGKWVPEGSDPQIFILLRENSSLHYFLLCPSSTPTVSGAAASPTDWFSSTAIRTDRGSLSELM